MKIILTFLLAVSLCLQFYGFPKKSLVERYTNSGCGPCKVTNDNWYTVTTQNLIDLNSISHIVYNVSWPDPQDPMYLFNSADNTAKWTYYGVNSVPWMVVNGATITMSNTSSSYLTNAVTAGNSQSSPFKIILTSEIFPNNILNVHVKILREPSDYSSYTNTKLKIALTERHIYFVSAPGIGSNGERTFYSISRKMLPNAGGTLFNPPTPGDSTEMDMFYTCSDAFRQTVIMDSVRVVAFLQDDNTKTIYQSEMTDLNKTAHMVSLPSLLNMGNIEIPNSSGSIKTVLKNWNTVPCVISNITSETGPFKLIDNLSYPLTVPANDSLTLHFKFTPAQTGLVKGYISVTSNDNLFKGITLVGRGYKIDPSVINKFYASSGANNNGSLLTIDPSTGTGTNIGPSLYTEIRSIAADPKSHLLYGIYSTSVNTEFVRMNASGGDSYNLFTTPVADMSSIAFDNKGALYAAARSGVIYTVDLSSGNLNPVCSLNVKVQSISFNPLNNELWGTYFSVIGGNKDKIFKIDLASGDTSNVGNTGTAIITNSIAFDNSGNLYGLVGSASQRANLLSINKTNGVGTLIGSTSVSNLTGLCYSFPSPQGINDLNSIPSEFELSQNYPNPFNPSTTIKYSLPYESEVKITIFNTLGEVVKTFIPAVQTVGSHEVTLNAARLSSGVYFYTLNASSINGKRNFIGTKKMILIQ
jgi:hypothetical protein